MTLPKFARLKATSSKEAHAIPFRFISFGLDPQILGEGVLLLPEGLRNIPNGRKEVDSMRYEAHDQRAEGQAA